MFSHQILYILATQAVRCMGKMMNTGKMTCLPVQFQRHTDATKRDEVPFIEDCFALDQSD